MSFVDIVKVTVVAGRGGDGRRSFRREKFIARGGPDGGDGGNGGDVIIRASDNQNTLAAFRYKKELRAKDGQPGGNKRKHGKTGENLIVDVPLGTEVRDQDNNVIADLVTANDLAVIAKGGKGGFGNAHFSTSTRQAPNFAEKGEAGERLGLTFELKLIADVGLVGLPNAGKSTLLSKLSNARPEIADYPFTTLIPNLGVVDIDDQTSILMADIPGLIEGAASGKGLGHEFLRHIERTRLIVHLIDAYSEDIAASYQVIRDELKAYSTSLAKLPEVIVLNKVEGLSEAEIAPLEAELKKSAKKTKIIPVSALAGTNLPVLKHYLKSELTRLKAKAAAKAEPEPLPVISLPLSPNRWQIEKVKDGYKVTGSRIEQFATRTDFRNKEAVARIRDIMRRQGIVHELTRRGLSVDDWVYIGNSKRSKLKF